MSARRRELPGLPGVPAAPGPVLVVGTAALDRVLRLAAPLVPGGKVDAGEDRERLGGGGANAALALARAGTAVRLAATLGGDPAGDLMLSELEGAGVETSLVRRAPGAGPGALVLVDPSGERTVVRTGARAGSPPLPRNPGPLACLFVRGAPPGVADTMRRAAASCLVVAHVPPCGRGSRPAHVLVGSASDLDRDFLAEPFRSGRRAAGRLLRWVVVTRGAEGAEAFGEGGRRLRVRARQVKVADSTGAGDAFAAGLVHALLGGASMEEALGVAAAWGAAAVRGRPRPGCGGRRGCPRSPRSGR